jgi:hypothetical protein
MCYRFFVSFRLCGTGANTCTGTDTGPNTDSGTSTDPGTSTETNTDSNSGTYTSTFACSHTKVWLFTQTRIIWVIHHGQCQHGILLYLFPVLKVSCAKVKMAILSHGWLPAGNIVMTARL